MESILCFTNQLSKIHKTSYFKNNVPLSRKPSQIRLMYLFYIMKYMIENILKNILNKIKKEIMNILKFKGFNLFCSENPNNINLLDRSIIVLFIKRYLM